MKPIISVTVNPAIDISATVPVMIPDRKLRCSHALKEPGGGGINISRVIRRFGGNTKAIYFSGGYTGKFFNSMLEKENVISDPITIENDTRENIVIHDAFSRLQYRLGMPGPIVKESEWKKFLEKISAIEDAAFIVASGSLSEGMPIDFFGRVAEIARVKNIKFILDTCGEPLREALNKGVYLIKPNLGELAGYSGEREINKPEAIAIAKGLIQKKYCEVVVISMGPAGALLITDLITEQINAPLVKVKSAVGAGDSMVAGIIWGLTQEKCIKDSVRFGVACGTASTLIEGTGLCQPEDAQRLFVSMNINY